MASLDGIGSSSWLLDRLARGQSRRSDATAAANAYAPVIRQTFVQTVTDVMQRAQHGAYDDPDVAAEIKRLRAKILASSAPNSPGLTPSPGSGAHAGPVDPLGGPPGTVDGSADAGGARAAPPMTDSAGGAVSADARRLAILEQQQAQTRLERVRATLHARFTHGATMASALDGGLDIASFRPASKAQAAAFAERLAIDLTEGAAQLEVTASQLQLARIDAASDPSRRPAVAELEQRFAREQSLLVRIAAEVDQRSGGSVQQSIRAGSAPLSALASEARRAGMDEQTVRELGTLDSMAREEAATGNSQSVNALQSRLNSTIMNWFMQREAQRDEMRREEQRRQDEQYDRDKAVERKRQYQSYLDQSISEFVQRVREQQTLADAYAQQRADQRRAEYLAAVQARYQSAS